MLTIIAEDAPQTISEEKYPAISPLRRVTTDGLLAQLTFYQPILKYGCYSDRMPLDARDLIVIHGEVQDIEAELSRREELRPPAVP